MCIAQRVTRCGGAAVPQRNETAVGSKRISGDSPEEQNRTPLMNFVCFPHLIPAPPPPPPSCACSLIVVTQIRCNVVDFSSRPHPPPTPEHAFVCFFIPGHPRVFSMLFFPLRLASHCTRSSQCEFVFGRWVNRRHSMRRLERKTKLKHHNVKRQHVASLLHSNSINRTRRNLVGTA